MTGNGYLSVLICAALISGGAAIAKDKPSNAAAPKAKNVSTQKDKPSNAAALKAKNESIQKDKSSNAGTKSVKSGNQAAKSKNKLSAKDLKSLNAAKANIRALTKASDNSKIGKISIYKNAALETIAAKERLGSASINLEKSTTIWTQAKEKLDAFFKSYDGRSSEDIQADLNALDISSDSYFDDKANLEKEKSAFNAFVMSYNNLVGVVNDAVSNFDSSKELLKNAQDEYQKVLAEEQNILADELDSPDLSEEALEQLRSLLDL